MTTIYRDNAGRLSVADAKRLILEALPPERSVDVYARVDENGDFDFEGPVELKERMGVHSYEMFIHRDFQATCQSVNVQPRMRYSPALTDYAGTGSSDLIYTIAHDEFLRLAALYDLSVVVGRAPEPQAAPVVAASASETTEQRRTRWLDWYGKGERGAVQAFTSGSYC